eukprot:scaffold11254_cov103-Alexandrium_tamarense.AAC.3
MDQFAYAVRVIGIQSTELNRKILDNPRNYEIAPLRFHWEQRKLNDASWSFEWGRISWTTMSSNSPSLLPKCQTPNVY